MLCTQILGNAFDSGLTSGNEELYGFEIVALNGEESSKELRKKTDLGREIVISLPPNTLISHGDILYRDEDNTILLFLQTCEVAVVYADSMRQIVNLAYELGKRGLSLELSDDGQLVLLPDRGTLEWLEKLNVRYELQIRRFQPFGEWQKQPSNV